MSELKLSAVQVEIDQDQNVIIGQSHFIKTVEDLFETLSTSSPTLKFGIAFCEASDKRLIRRDGNDAALVECAVRNAKNIGAGHSFVVVLKDGYPINVMARIKAVEEVCCIFAATANPLQILVADTEQGRGIIGVVDGGTPLGVETDEDAASRRALLRSVIGYKR